MSRALPIGLGFFLALVAGASVRWGSAAAPREIPRAEPAPPEEFRAAPASEEPTSQEAIVRITEDVLGLTRDEARAFRSAVLSAVEDVDRAWAVREEGWIAVSSSAAADPELLARLEGEIQFRYESEKGRALQRLAAQLKGSGRHEWFLDYLEEWFDALR